MTERGLSGYAMCLHEISGSNIPRLEMLAYAPAVMSEHETSGYGMCLLGISGYTMSGLERSGYEMTELERL